MPFSEAKAQKVVHDLLMESILSTRCRRKDFKKAINGDFSGISPKECAAIEFLKDAFEQPFTFKRFWFCSEEISLLIKGYSKIKEFES